MSIRIEIYKMKIENQFFFLKKLYTKINITSAHKTIKISCNTQLQVEN